MLGTVWRVGARELVKKKKENQTVTQESKEGQCCLWRAEANNCFDTCSMYKIRKCEHTVRERCHFKKMTALRSKTFNWFRENPKLRLRQVCSPHGQQVRPCPPRPGFAVIIRNLPWAFYVWRSKSPSSLLTFWDNCLDFLPSINRLILQLLYSNSFPSKHNTAACGSIILIRGS